MATLRYPYLISKTLDPIFGIAIGASAFYLYERREGRVEVHTLNELVKRRYKLEMAKFRNQPTAEETISESQKQKRLAEAAIFENTTK
ncbi:uncharacterized protein V1513DRAFT_462607 [Lipomyces chichibuensis]|uniref:uncharacterized protein n=1 Tax=Lipomyces chichibuensis TaxID=1546026 RepID=UPI003343784A